MKISVVFLTSDVLRAEILLRECCEQNLEVVLVDLGLQEFPRLPSGVKMVYVKPNVKSVSEAINRGLEQIENNFLLLNDQTLDSLVNFNILVVAAKTMPKLAAIFASRKSYGTNVVGWVPVFGSFYVYRVFKEIGRL